MKSEFRRIAVPRNRLTPLRSNWENIVKALVEFMKLQVRMNTKRKAIEIRVHSYIYIYIYLYIYIYIYIYI